MKILRAALISYTRLPLGSQGLDAGHFQRSLVYLPAVGLIVGLLAALVYQISRFYWPAPIAVFLALAASVLITGALHEDGFADCCDGFGASRDKPRILAIMKDSTNGSFGQLGLLGMMLGKLLFLCTVLPEQQALALIMMHSFARFSPLFIVSNTPHCQAANSKMSANLQLSRKALLTASAIAFLSALLFVPLGFMLLLVLSLWILNALARRFFIARLGGFNGDCLGAVEQLSECLIVLLFIAYF